MGWTPPPDGIAMCQGGVAFNPLKEEASVEQVSIIGIDLAKNSFQVHGAHSDGSVAFRRKLTRAKVMPFLTSQSPCMVAMEACAGAHHWGREIGELGHQVKLMALLLNRMRHLVMAAARQARSLAPGARPTRWNQLR